MKTVLIAVVASAEHPYPQLVRTSLETWDAVPVEGMDTLFYFDNAFKGQLPPKSIIVNADGALNSMGKRDLLAYDWMLKNKAWDYMARVNASCYVRKKKLMKYAQTLPEKNLFRGILATHYTGNYMWGGGQYLISRDVVQAMVAHQDRWDHKSMEDESMSFMCRGLGIPLDGTGRACALHDKRPKPWLCLWYDNGQSGGWEANNFQEIIQKLGEQFYVRVKQDLRRNIDMEMMRELAKADT